MIAFKGFSPDLTARLGRGRYQFTPGKTEQENKSKTASCGFHCCEDPFDCLTYYNLQSDRFFMVEAAGSIDEDEKNRIACTEITLLQELTTKQMAGYGMMYIIKHPKRSNWQKNRSGIVVDKEQAEAHAKNHIAIARGCKPRVKGVEGAILGLIMETADGEIASAKLFTATRQQAGKWYTITENRKLKEINHEM